MWTPWDEGCPVGLRDPKPCPHPFKEEGLILGAALDARASSRCPVYASPVHISVLFLSL